MEESFAPVTPLTKIGTIRHHGGPSASAPSLHQPACADKGLVVTASPDARSRPWGLGPGVAGSSVYRQIRKHCTGRNFCWVCGALVLFGESHETGMRLSCHPVTPLAPQESQEEGGEEEEEGNTTGRAGVWGGHATATVFPWSAKSSIAKFDDGGLRFNSVGLDFNGIARAAHSVPGIVAAEAVVGC
jgi:hypothetical protein